MTSPQITCNELSREIDLARERRRKLTDEMTQIHEGAKGRDLTAGEQERWNNLERGVAKLNTEEAKLKEAWGEEVRRGVADGTFQTIGPAENCNVPGYRSADYVEGQSHRLANRSQTAGEALRAVSNDRAASDAAKERATQLLESEREDTAAKYLRAVADPNYAAAYASLLVDPDRGHLGWTPPMREAFDEARTLSRSMSIGTDSAGGYLVPFALDPTFIITNDGTSNPLRQIAKTAQIVTAKWHGITTDGVTAEWKAEGAQAADATPTLAQPEIEAHLADVYVPYSIEAEQDITTLVAELGAAMLDAKDRIEATAFTLGNGTGQPTGVITAVAADSGSVVPPLTAETFAVGDIYNLAELLPARHQAGASWLTAPALEYKIRQFATGTGPQSAFWSDLTGGTPPSLLGKPFRTASDMDSTWDPAVTAAHNYLLLIGDFSKYQIVDRLGVTTEIVPHVFGANGRPTGQRGLFMYWRVGADCLDTNAFRLLDIPTAA